MVIATEAGYSNTGGFTAALFARLFENRLMLKVCLILLHFPYELCVLLIYLQLFSTVTMLTGGFFCWRKEIVSEGQEGNGLPC